MLMQRLNPTRRLAALIAFQCAILSAGIGWGAYRARSIENSLQWVPFRSEPLKVLPQYDIPEVVSHEQLERVLVKLEPVLHGPKTQINHVDHAQRMWGLAAKFPGTDHPSGEDLREILLNNNRFLQLYGPETQPLLVDENGFVRFRQQEGIATASHHDHTLCGQAEIGTPLNFPVVTPIRQTTLETVLETSLHDFSLNQVEYEWSALTYALFQPTLGGWYSTEGQWITFDRLASRLMREDLRHGVCAANHRMHALVMFLRINEQQQILTDECRQQILEFLQGVTATLVSTQATDGYWTKNWAGAPADMAKENELDPLSDKILATGHPLEWWALAPDEVLPPRHVLVAAGQWLATTIESMTPEQIEGSYTFLTHAGRALALWRGKSPAEVELSTPEQHDGR